MTRARVNGLVI